jgi:iron complex outermembrane receptor protein
MKLYFSALFIIGNSLVSYSQVTISGHIKDAQNNALFGVEIYAPELHIGTTSNLDGNFKLDRLPHGEIIINFTFIGFESISRTFNLHEDLIDLDIILNASVFNIDEVIISTPFNRLQSENVMKVEHATLKQMKQQGVLSLIEGLENIPGISQISTGTSIGKPVIRGLSGNRVLVYAQGVRLENQQFGDEHGLGLNQAGIESVEVIKGPASLLYGSDALGGVIYFNPEKFALAGTLKSDFGQQYYSNTNGSNTTIGLKRSYDQWKYLIRGSYDTHQDYQIPNKNTVTNSRYNELNFNSGIGFNNKLISSELRYNYNLSKIGLTEGISDQSKSRNPQLPKQEIYNHILSLHNHIHFDTSKLDVNLGYILNDRNEFEEAHEDHSEPKEDHEAHEPALSMKLRTFNYDLKYHFPKMNNINLILGVQGLSQTNTNLGEELLIPNAKINDIGAFTTATIDFEKSSLLAGFRVDSRSINTEYHEVQHEDETHFFEAIQKDYSSFTASLGYRIDLLDNLVSRINLASGYRAPNLAELTSNGVHHGTNRFEIGNSNLSNEQNFQTDISLAYKSEHIELFANGFYNILNDYIYLDPTGAIEDGADVYTYTQQNANLYGGEFGFHLHPHPLDWLHLESSFEMVIGKEERGDYLPLIPANKWSNSIRTEFNLGDWLTNGYSSLNIASLFEQDKVSSFETTTRGYTLVNFGIGGKFRLLNTHFELSVNLNNAFNKTYISHLSRLKAMNIPNIGRNFIVGLNFNI